MSPSEAASLITPTVCDSVLRGSSLPERWTHHLSKQLANFGRRIWRHIANMALALIPIGASCSRMPTAEHELGDLSAGLRGSVFRSIVSEGSSNGPQVLGTWEGTSPGPARNRRASGFGAPLPHKARTAESGPRSPSCSKLLDNDVWSDATCKPRVLW